MNLQKLGIASQMSQIEGGYLEQKCHLSQFQLVRDCRGDGGSSCLAGFGSHGHVGGQLCVKSLETSIPVSGINVKNG